MSSDPHMKMCEFEVPAGSPTSIKYYIEAFVNEVLADVIKGRVDHLVALMYNDKGFRRWQIYGVPEADDLVRAIAVQEEALALAFVYSTPLPPEVDEGERGYMIAVECAYGKFDQLVSLWGGEGLGGEFFRLYGRQVTETGNRWLGVAPRAEVDMWMEGYVGMMGPLGEA